MTIRVSLLLQAILALLSAAPASEPSTYGAATRNFNLAPPADAIALFDGHNLDAWLSQKERQWESGDGPADWTIEPDGALQVVTGAGSLITKQRFGDFQLHLEFRLLGGETNGGIFLMSRYELGIKDPGIPSDPRCCAFENLKNPIRPVVRADRLAKEWNSLDVTFRAPRLADGGEVIENARATVVLNGVTIHDNVELGARKGAAKRLGDAKEGPLMLQEHGAPYQFRNIWIVDKTKLEML
jgi:hypothetical protein